jgi:hypothetical protein
MLRITLTIFRGLGRVGVGRSGTRTRFVCCVGEVGCHESELCCEGCVKTWNTLISACPTTLPRFTRNSGVLPKSFWTFSFLSFVWMGAELLWIHGEDV